MLWLAPLILAVVATALYANLKARQAERRYPPLGAFVEVEGVRLHYLRRGAGRPVVLLHGSDGFLQDYSLTVLDALAREYDVIAFDRPGHGYSTAPVGKAMTPSAQARLLLGAMRQLKIEKPLLVGHSWSGLLALIFALDYPDEAAGLVLLAPWVYPQALRPSLLLQIPLLPLVGPLLGAILLPPVKSALIYLFAKQAFAPASTPPAYAALARALWQRWPRQIVTFAQENTTDRAAMQRYSPRYPQIAMPVVILTGDADQSVNPAHHALPLAANLRHAHLISLAGKGHALLFSAPDNVIDAIRACSQAVATLIDATPATETPCLKPTALGQDVPARARELVFRYGWNATAYQILNPAMTRWLAPDGNAVVGYVRRHGVRVVAGAPICAASRLADVAGEFEREAREAGETVCYFGAATRLQNALRALPAHAAIAIGSQPMWKPARWEAILARHGSLRAQLNRARNKGVCIAEWDAPQAAENADLQSCLNEWLDDHSFPTLHFLTEPIALDRLADRRIFVAEREGKSVGFLIATPVPDRNGWLVEQIVRGRDAPNGTVELLINGMMRTLAAEAVEYVTLGLAPLSRHAPVEAPRPWIRLLLSWVRAHGERFYNFDGLDAFKAKFKPDAWEPIYALSNEARFSLRTLYAIAAAFSDGSPIRAILRALFAALRQEAVWLREKRAQSGANAAKDTPANK